MRGKMEVTNKINYLERQIGGFNDDLTILSNSAKIAILKWALEEKGCYYSIDDFLSFELRPSEEILERLNSLTTELESIKSDRRKEEQYAEIEVLKWVLDGTGNVCKELKDILKRKPFFDCVGGCGVDLSYGESNCMSSNGVWFKYCPYCGREIVSRKTENGSWEWFEVSSES